MNTRLCYNCNKEVKYIEKTEKKSYTYRGSQYIIDDTIKICPICGEEVCLNMDDIENNIFFKTIYNKYLKQYNLNMDSFKEIRKKYNLSQEQFAKLLGWSKKSINRYENNQSIPQGEYLNLYQRLNLNDNEIIKILNDRRNQIDELEYNNILSKLQLKYSYKDCNLILSILKDNKLHLTQLMKYLFASDFLSYKKHNQPISTFKYAALPHGPVVNDYKELMNYLIQNNYVKIEVLDENNYLIVSNSDINDKLFNKQELQIIDEIKSKFKGKNSNDLSEWSHNFIGWKNTKTSAIINYKYAKELNI